MTGSLCIRNAMLVSPTGILPGGILSEEGRITAILTAADHAEADESIDAKGQLLFPGFIDTHVHFRDPGLTHKEDFGSGSEAAAVGGVTTVMCMPNTEPQLATVAAFELARAAGESASHVDFCLQGSITSENLEDVSALWASGVSSFEINLSDGAEGPSVERIDDYGLLLDIMRLTSRLGAPLGMYTGLQAITARETKRLRDNLHRNDVRAHAEARPPVAEAVGIAAAVELARDADARVVFREVTTARGFDLLRRAKRERPPGKVVVEATPHHAIETIDALDRLGTAAQIVPPLRDARDQAGTLLALQDGTVDIVGSDHAPHADFEKTDNPWVSRNGTPGLEVAAAALLDLAQQGLLPYQDICRVYASAPAAAFGLSDRKGAIACGMDADLVLVDPCLRRKVSPDIMKSKMKRCALEGKEFVGWPVLTVLRGDVIVNHFEMTSARVGRFIAGMGSK